MRDFSQNLAIKPQIVLHCTPLDGAEWRADGVITKGGVTDFSSGIQYWEPAWITSNMKDLWGSGSSWDNNTLFDFSGNVLVGFEYMTHPYKF